MSWKKNTPPPKTWLAIAAIGAVGSAVMLGLAPKVFSWITTSSGAVKNKITPPGV